MPFPGTAPMSGTLSVVSSNVTWPVAGGCPSRPPTTVTAASVRLHTVATVTSAGCALLRRRALDPDPRRTPSDKIVSPGIRALLKDRGQVVVVGRYPTGRAAGWQ